MQIRTQSVLLDPLEVQLIENLRRTAPAQRVTMHALSFDYARLFPAPWVYRLTLGLGDKACVRQQQLPRLLMPVLSVKAK